MSKFDFDTDGIDPMRPLGALPPATYNFVVVDAEVKDAKSGRGQYLQVTSDVQDGDMAGMKLFDRFNIAHENKTAEDIGRRQLAAFLHSIELPRVTDTDELIGREFTAEVKVDRNKETGAESNKVAAYITRGAKPAASKPAAPVAAAKASPPWQRNKAA